MLAAAPQINMVITDIETINIEIPKKILFMRYTLLNLLFNNNISFIDMQRNILFLRTTTLFIEKQYINYDLQYKST